MPVVELYLECRGWVGQTGKCGENSFRESNMGWWWEKVINQEDRRQGNEVLSTNFKKLGERKNKIFFKNPIRWTRYIKTSGDVWSFMDAKISSRSGGCTSLVLWVLRVGGCCCENQTDFGWGVWGECISLLQLTCLGGWDLHGFPYDPQGLGGFFLCVCV